MFELKNTEIPIEISINQLSEQAIAGIVENFILREGTDYGINEISYEKKAAQVRRQIENGDVKIVFDQSAETVTLLTCQDFRRLMNRQN